MAIRAELAAAKNAARSAIEHARRAGELLLEAKQVIPHGGWGRWLADHCEISPRTARAYMQLARRLAEMSEVERQRVADLPLRGLCERLAEPKPITTSDPFDEIRDEIDRLVAERAHALKAEADALLESVTIENQHEIRLRAATLDSAYATNVAAMKYIERHSTKWRGHASDGFAKRLRRGAA